jgi:hypothetical protein
VSEGIIICGIFGAVALNQDTKWNEGIVRGLAWANRERGTDSLGFFDSSGKMTKGAGDPSSILGKTRVCEWLANSQRNAWFVAGHTRFATRGAVNRKNSHPFRYGRIIGSHNGMCDAPRKFAVDSEYLFYSLNKARGDYQKALEGIGGYWGLSWYDGEHFYLMCHNGELAYDIVDGVLYYSSNWAHLESCTGGDSTVLKTGQVLRIGTDGVVENSIDDDSALKKFEHAKTTTSYYGSYSEYDFTGSNHVSTGRSRNYSSGGRGGAGRKETGNWSADQGVNDYLNGGRATGDGDDADANVKDYDDEWQTAWADYCTESAHTADSNEGYAG